MKRIITQIIIKMVEKILQKIEEEGINKIGELKFERTYFKLKDGSMSFIIDEIIGIEAYERITKELCAKLVQNAARMSMAKAAKVEGVKVSRQTVNNKVMSMKDVVTEIKREERTPKEIHIFADEDHVHLRPKRNTMVPLVTVTEGIDKTNPKRHKTISATHFQGCGVETHAFLENVVAAIYEKYDMNKVEKVIVHGDGGRWIKNLKELLPDAVLVMDGFHLEKYLKKIFSLKEGGVYEKEIRKSIKENDFKTFVSYCDLIDKNQDKEGRKKLRELVKYFKNNWYSIVERMRGTHCGSCTEPLISHTLSERLSRNPLAWTKEGLAKMAMLRVFSENGGIVKASHIRVSRSKTDRQKDFNARKKGFERYNKYAEEQVKSVISGHYDWSIFDHNRTPAVFSSGKLSGTTVLLRSCANLKAM